MLDPTIHKTQGEDTQNKKYTTQYVLDPTIHKTQGEDTQNNKYTTQYVLDTTIHKTQGEDTQNNKYTTQYVLDPTIRKQTQITQIRLEPSYKQLEVKTNRISFLYGNRNGHHNTELRT